MVEWLQALYDSFYKALVPEQRYMAYLSGLRMTLLIAVFAVLLGAIIGILVAVAKVGAKHSRNPILQVLAKICGAYTTFIRGTPALVQVMIIYNLVFTSADTNPVVVGAVCFGINSGAYVSEIIRAGIQAVDKGQTEAARSLGLNSHQTMVHVIMPQAVKNILPALCNEFVTMIKETSLASTFFVGELMTQYKSISGALYLTIEPLIIVGVIYFVVTFSLSKCVLAMERRMRASD